MAQRDWTMTRRAVLAGGLATAPAIAIAQPQIPIRFPPILGVISRHMAPTLEKGERVVCLSALWPGEPAFRRADVAVFGVEGSLFLMRLIGMPGDEVEIVDGAVVLNKQILPRRKVDRPTAEPGEQPFVETLDGRAYTIFVGGPYEQNAREYRNMAPLRLGEDEVFALGDNRDNSYDCRAFGPVLIDQVLGRAERIFFSWDAARVGKALAPAEVGDPR